MAVTRLSGGLSPADGSDPRTFPAIWNATATDIEAAEADIAAIKANNWVTTARINNAAVTAAKLANTAGAVMVFADAAARDAAIPTPAEGMAAYLSDSNSVQLYDGAAWKRVVNTTGSILQVVSTTKTDTFSASVATGAISADVTGLTATVTPSATGNKVLITGVVNVSTSVVPENVDVLIYRDGSALAGSTGDAAGSRVRVTSSAGVERATALQAVVFRFLDAPGTTSATTYSVRLHHSGSGTQTVLVNRTSTDTDNNRFPRSASSISVMEVAG